MALHRGAAKDSQAQQAALHGTKGVGERSGMDPTLATNLDADEASENAGLASSSASSPEEHAEAAKLHSAAGKKQGALGHNTMASYHADQATVRSQLAKGD